MNKLKLENRTDSDAGIKIVRSCLEQIKDYNYFLEMKRKVTDFLNEKYPELMGADVIGIRELVYIYTRNYEHPNKSPFQSPRSMVSNPFSFGLSESNLDKILKSIKENEKDYLSSLSNLYPQYS